MRPNVGLDVQVVVCEIRVDEQEDGRVWGGFGSKEVVEVEDGVVNVGARRVPKRKSSESTVRPNWFFQE